MPGTLEREAAGLTRELAAVDEARRLILARAGEVVAEAVAAARRVITRWREECVAVARGETARVHALRDQLRAEAEARLNDLNAARPLAGGAEAFDGAEQELRVFLGRVFPRWNTPDDLEELAVEWFPLSNERLLRLAVESPAPPAWHQQDAPQP